MRRTLLATGLFAIALTPGFANPIVINNTGNGSTTDGTADPNWTYTNSGGTTAQALVANNGGVDFFNGNCCGGGPWTPDTATSSWLVDNISNTRSGGDPLTFQTTFDLTGLDPMTATLTGSWGIDDGGTLELNGVAISDLPGQSASHWDTTGLNAFSVAAGSGDFVAGINTLEVVFTDNDDSFEGVNVRVSGTASALAAPEPGTLLLFAAGFAALALFSSVRSRRVRNCTKAQ
jgi:hypothetical protein